MVGWDEMGMSQDVLGQFESGELGWDTGRCGGVIQSTEWAL